MKDKYTWVSIIAAAVLVLDQLTKHLVTRNIPRFGIVRVIPGFFDIINVRNPGAAFGILAGDHGGWRLAFFIVVSIVALAVIAVMIRRTTERMMLAAFALVGGGAGGNLIDRVRFGGGVGFIDWHYRAWHWPTFNIADSAISIGVGLLVIDMLFTKRRDTAPTV